MSEQLKLIGRLTKENYMHNNEIVSKCKFKLLKRKSKGQLQDLICDEFYDIPKLDMHRMDEGIYELTATNISTDYETGIVDDWGIKLIEAVE
jgi:hypothetical protein